MLVRKAKVFPVECVARGFLTGSGLKDYNKTGKVCGIPLPAGSARFRSLAGADLHSVDKSRDRSR